MTTSNSPLIIAFVSGKGGVGKTMLAVAAAKELSEAGRTLLIDLDFFNRGLTGLLKGGTALTEIRPPSFLAAVATETETSSPKWELKEVARNLVHVDYPDLSREDIEKFETLEVRTLCDSLRQFVREAATSAKCECVILDCHGGPDNSSFAACMLADFTILVSEPDRITFYGTLHFLRRLEYVRGNDPVDIRLVFNKVVAGFSGFFLTKFYDEQVKDLFHGRPLLAIFPLEVYLTKEFEKEPFLTRVYPNSFLARKTQELLFDLLQERHSEVLPVSLKRVPGWLRKYRRYALGRRNPMMSFDVIFGALATFVLLLLSAGWLESLLTPKVGEISGQITRLELAVLAAHNPEFFGEYSSEVQAALGGQLPANAVFADIDHVLYDAQLRNAKSGKTTGSSAPWSTVEDRAGAGQRVQDQWEKLTKIEDLPDYPWQFKYQLRYIRDSPNSAYINVLRYRFRTYYPLEEINQLQAFQRYIANSRKFTPQPAYTAYPQDAGALKKATSGSSIYIWGYLRRFTDVVESHWVEIVFFGWFMLAILLDQTERLDRQFVYAVRKKRWTKAVVIQVLEWALRVFCTGLLMFVVRSSRRGIHEYTEFVVFGVLVSSILIAIAVHAYSTYRQVRYERRWGELLVRGCVSIAVVVMGFFFAESL